MNQGSDLPHPGPDASDPYERLGVAPDASFDTVQEAKLARLQEAGEDPMVRSRIEAAYDAVLMDRLKERQQGRVSSAARSASQREQASPPPSRPALSALPSLPQLPPRDCRARASPCPVCSWPAAAISGFPWRPTECCWCCWC